MDIMALLLADAYKQVHAEQYNKDIVKLVSYLAPRMSRLESQNEMILFGLQSFCKEYLIRYFDNNFFLRKKVEVLEEYERVLDAALGAENYDIGKVSALWDLNYLPIKISALPEGTRVPMKVPCIEIENTSPKFAWVVQWVESLLSAEIWKSCIHANVGYSYRQIVDKYYDLSVDDDVLHCKAISDFGFRGMSCVQEAIKASSAWLLSFTNTSTIPAIPYLEEYYNCDCTKEIVGLSAISTEHSVMTSNYSLDGNDELPMIRRLLTELYPNSSFSMVSDSYDYWNLVLNLLPQVKEEVLAHNGKLLIRPDSGNIIDISVRTVEALWDIFGGTTNSKGYKVLDKHIGVIYGDGVTQERARTIYELLMDEGFAANNIVFGAGSFSFNAIEENGVLKPYTRDTFSVAIKATYGELSDGTPVMIYKDPKTDTDNFKKSAKGRCHVFLNEKGELTYQDGFSNNTMSTCDIKPSDINLLETVFCDSEMVKEQSLAEIRQYLHRGKF